MLAPLLFHGFTTTFQCASMTDQATKNEEKCKLTHLNSRPADLLCPGVQGHRVDIEVGGVVVGRTLEPLSECRKTRTVKDIAKFGIRSRKEKLEKGYSCI